MGLIMERLKKTVAAGLIFVIGLFALTSCSKTVEPARTKATTETTQISRGPLDVTKVTYLIYVGGLANVKMYVITPDLKVQKYDIWPEVDKTYDYLAGELPSEDHYDVTEYEITDTEWSSIVNVLTRVDFMALDEDTSTKELVDDGPCLCIKVETSDSTHISGGYYAGLDDDPDSRRFAEAREMIENVCK
jgi:hypothetical protein